MFSGILRKSESHRIPKNLQSDAPWVLFFENSKTPQFGYPSISNDLVSYAVTIELQQIYLTAIFRYKIVADPNVPLVIH